MAAEELGRRVDDHVRAVLQGAQQVGGRDRVVDDQRDADLVGDVGDGAQVGDVLLRVRDRLDEEGAGGVVGRGAPGLGIRRVLDPLRGDAEAGQGVLEEVVGAAVEGRGDGDRVAGAGEVEDRQGDRALPGGDEEPGRPALERRDAVLDRGLGGVGDAGVDRGGLGEREAVRGGLRRGEDEAGRLVDGQGARARVRVGGLAGVDGEGLELLVLLRHGCAPPGRRGLRSACPSRAGRARTVNVCVA